MRKAAEVHFTRSTQRRGRNQEYETAAAHRAQCRRDLRSLRHLHPQSWQVRNARARANEADHRVRAIKRAKRRELERARLIELQEAWERRDFATTWKLTRILTGKRIGPKKRRLAAPQAASFCKHEWMEHLAKPGSQGGCSATPVDVPQTRHVPETDYTHAARWARIIEPRFRRCLARAPFRKAPPAWSFPGALWRLLVDPNTFRDKQRHGIGFVQHRARTEVFNEVFRALVWHMSASRKTPKNWHVSQGFTLSKNNNKSGISGLRLVHTLDAAGKAYYSQLWKLDKHSWQRDYATGYCHRRRREQAIAQQGVLRERFRTAKKNLTATLYDLTNAFACGTQGTQTDDLTTWLVWYEQRYKTLQHENISARDWQVRNYDSTAQTADWKQRLEVGHSQATQWQDAGSYYTSTRNWILSYRRHPSSKLMRLCPLKYKTLRNHWMWAHQHTQMTSFERLRGPLLKTLLKRSITPTALLTLLWRLTMFKTAVNRRYSLILLVAGHTQSFDSFLVIYTIWKVVCIAVFGIWDHTSRLTESLNAKYHEGPRMRETHIRYLNVFFAKTESLRWRRVVFRAMVVGVALSGLVAFTPSSTETNKVDKCLLALARKALRGAATYVDGHIRTRSSRWIWKQLKLAPTDVSLAVQRLLWWQQIIADPSCAWTFLFTFFGRIPGLPDVVDNNGAITPSAHSWIRLLVSETQQCITAQ